MDVGVAQFPVLVHSTERLRSVLYRFPVVADNLVADLRDAVFVLPATHMAVEGTRFDPGCLQQGRLGTRRGDDDVGFTGRAFQVAVCLFKLHRRQNR